MSDRSWPEVVDEAPLFEVAVREVDKPGQTSWTVHARSPLEAVESVLGMTETVMGTQSSLHQRHRQLGQDLLEIAALSMPDSYFMQDDRVRRAAAAMGLSLEQAVEWMQHL